MRYLRTIVFPLLSVIILALALQGCGGGGGKSGVNPPGSDPQNYLTYLYVGNTHSNDLKVYSALTDGTINLLMTHTWGEPKYSVYATEATPDGKHLALVYYDSSQSAYILEIYSINQQTGDLDFPCGSASLGTSQPFTLLFTPDSKFLYLLDDKSNILGFSLGSNGTLTSLGKLVTLDSFAVRNPALTPDGSYLYVPGWKGYPNNSYKLHIYKVESGGYLTLTNTYDTGRAPDSVVFSGQYVYLGQLDGIDCFKVINPGEITKLATFTEGQTLAPILQCVDKSGKYMLGTSYTDKKIEVFQINPVDGTLTSKNTFDTDISPMDFAFHPNNRLLYITCSSNGSSANLYTYSFNLTTGDISNGQGYSVGDTPWDISLAKIATP